MKRCPACGEENPPRAKFCLECATALPEATAPPRELRKVVTVVFADITGSTALGEQLDPESLRRVMARYFDAMRSVIERHGGTVEKFIGDAVMAVFGIPQVHEDDALRAVRAAAEMRDELERLNASLREERGVAIAVRTGINTGEVVAGDAGVGQGFATGDAVNVAARLEQSARPGEILLGATTYSLVRDAVEVEVVAPLALKGKAEPVAALRLLAVRPDAPGRRRRLDSPLVGRERERRLLQDALARALAERACHLFTLLGAAGVGKSRIVTEFVDGLGEGTRVIRGRCLSYGEGITYWPLEEALHDLTGGSTAAAVTAGVRDLMNGEADGDVVSARIAGLLGTETAVASAQEGAWATRRLLEVVARAQPLVVLFDDVHWAEPTFLDLVEHIADWSRDAPLLLLCVARPELLDARRGWSGDKFNATTVLLEPLGNEHAAALMANLLEGAVVPPAVATRIVDAAEGNPLFVEELVGMLVDEALVRRENGGWTVTGDLDRLEVPPTIQALLAARLDRLRLEERETAEAAAIEGKVFHAGAVQELLSPERRIDVDEALLSLLRRDLVRPNETTFVGEEAFRFRHQLIRDAAYEALPKDARADLHERFVGWLERLGQEHDEIVGYHLEQAARYRQELSPADPRAVELGTHAARRLATAGRAAAARGDFSAAAGLLRRAAGLAHGRPESAPMLYETARALFLGGGWAEAVDVFERAAEEARAAGDRSLELRAVMEGSIAFSRIDPSWKVDDLRAAAQDVLRTFAGSDDHLVQAAAHICLSEVSLELCQWEAAAADLERAVAHARSAGDALQAWIGLSGLSNAIYWGPLAVDEAIARCAAIREEIHDLGYGVAEGRVLCHLGGLEAMRGRFDDARRYLGAARDLFAQRGARSTLATAGALIGGPVEALAGAPEAADAIFTDARAYLSSVGETGVFSTIAGMHSLLLGDLGRWEDAAEALDDAERTTSADDRASQVLVRAARARVLLARGAAAEAEASAREGVAVAESTDFLNMQGEAFMALGRVLSATDRPEHARDAFANAAARFERKGNRVAATAAREAAAWGDGDAVVSGDEPLSQS